MVGIAKGRSEEGLPARRGGVGGVEFKGKPPVE